MYILFLFTTIARQVAENRLKQSARYARTWALLHSAYALHSALGGLNLVFDKDYMNDKHILCPNPRTTVTSARIPEEDVCHSSRHLCCFLTRSKRNTDIDA